MRGLYSLAAVALVASCNAPARSPRGPAVPVGAARAHDEPSAAPQTRDAEVESAFAPVVAGGSAPEVLEPEEPFASLSVEGGPSPVVSVARKGQPKRVVVATHGNYDRADWQCTVFRKIAGDDVFVLCPRGIARGDSPSADDTRFTYPNNQKLEAEIAADAAALSAKYADRIAAAPKVYAGFSLGAIMGVPILARAAKGSFDRAVLVEGGYDRIDANTARAFAAAGIHKVLFACGQGACIVLAAKTAALLATVHIEARVVGVKDAGHRYDGPVEGAIRDAWSWLLAD